MSAMESQKAAEDSQNSLGGGVERVRLHVG